MIFPNENNWIQVNGSDIEGSVQYSRNINLEDRGYVKLSNRMVAIKSENGDSNFDMPVALGYSSSQSFYIATVDQPYTLTYIDYITVVEDVVASNPSLSVYADGCTWQDRWYVTGSTTLSYKAYSGGAWTTVTLSPALTASKVHNMCVFENRQTMVIGNGNIVKQIDTSHADTINLTLPAQYSVNRIVYNNNRVGIIADCLSTDVSSSSYFFVWDGSSTEANQGIPIMANQDVGLVAYKSGFAITTTLGQFVIYNGSSFDELTVLPNKNTDVPYITGKVTRGRTSIVIGDNIYTNVPSNLALSGERGEQFYEKQPAGIWCYSPKRGIYNTQTNSSSLAFARTITTSNVDTTTDIITVTATVPPTGTPCRYYDAGGTILGGLSPRKTYYVIKLSSTTFKLASTKTNSAVPTAINLTGTGNNFQSITFFPEYDFGQSFSARTGGIVALNSLPKEANNIGTDFISAADLKDVALSEYAVMCMGIGGIENRGWIVTPRIYANNITDTFQSVFIYYKKLRYDVDKIVVKYRNKDFDVLNQPAYINATSIYSTWTSSTMFTTTDDFSSVVAGYEVDIIGGSGAGQTAHITTITENSGTYTVTLDEAIIGVTASDTCYVSVNNWIKAGTITYTDPDNFKKIPIEKQSAWIEFKIEMRGIRVRIDKLNIINSPHQKQA